MVIEVKVVPGASSEKILPLEPNRYKIYLRAPAIEGKANERLLEILSEHFNVRKSAIKLIRGEKSRNKVIEIHDSR